MTWIKTLLPSRLKLAPVHYHYFTLEQRESLERRIRSRIEDAPTQAETLQRLHSPDYGVCRICGADIPYVRLLDEPTALYCAACRPAS